LIEVNKIYNMDCLEGLKLIPDNSIDLVVTDPPYKTTSRGSSGGTGGILKDKLNMKGMVFEHNSIKFSEWLPELYRVLKERSHAYIMTNNKNLKDMLIEIENANFEIFKTLIWAKNSPITNMYYMDSHEYIIFCRKGKAKRINNCGTKSVLNIDNVKNKQHPTEKPIDLMKIFIENSSQENEIVLDPFMGAGSTAMACKELKRNFIGFELDKQYYDIANKRISEEMAQISLFYGVEVELMKEGKNE
jgi:site-specific DNA-methyltransferase (adenine-specific)